MENTRKEYKRIWRIRQEYFAVYGEYANRHKIEPISANFRPKPKKIQILNPHSIHVRIGKKNHLEDISCFSNNTWPGSPPTTPIKGKMSLGRTSEMGRFFYYFGYLLTVLVHSLFSSSLSLSEEFPQPRMTDCDSNRRASPQQLSSTSPQLSYASPQQLSVASFLLTSSTYGPYASNSASPHPH
jgi:hypothetical protein